MTTAADPTRPTRTAKWPEAIAFGALTAIGMQALTGVGLAFHYSPTPELAHASLRTLELDLPAVSPLRSSHAVGASFAVGLCALTLLQAFVRGAYKRPGRGAWISAAAMLVVVVALGVTGELLPWTEQAVYATDVRTGLVGATPVAGAAIRETVLGGDAVAGPTLLRFYVLHVLVLPAVLLALIALHLRAARRIREAGDAPWVTLREAGAALLVAGMILLAAGPRPRPLGEVFVAGDAGYEAWPEWYFLWLNMLLKVIPPSLEQLPAFWIPNGLAALLLLLPFLDRTPHRGLRHRPIALGGAAILLLALVGLSIANERERPTNDATLPYSLEMGPLVRRGYALVRRHGCVECHAYRDVGETQFEAPDLDDMDAEAPPDEFAEMIGNPEAILGTEDMPPYDYVPFEERRMMGLYLLWISR